ncbi:hypothetical protein CC1G_10543 [Coprinopsis cinerea okayama7|uniref:Uncharacterized protein n=1 Tax=Coprinopsis cinerea (strain Okayama-7 / 130 / ATCC MYA-4618 / FGSC 9003) TaxID=240176 RepID=A8N1C2_COPC7|nr:hypothetical protein CC1G_10543 [Coprinopsis cinerea okayama7\|eukprot:XP_001828671.2 hypothetical protein CC1G_10543 [Coprinopsis cinerea okayama7\
MVARYWDAVAVAAEHSVWIFFTHHPKRKPVRIDLPKEPPEKLIAADRICLAWAICNTTLSQPLLIISRGSLVYVYNVELEDICSYLRGHGGAITSIAVHPRYPDLFCTTSRDHSARIYNLRLPPVQAPNNPHWPPMPKQTPSRAGPAHGLHMNQPEGSGLGRCIIVLMGGRSGGHNAAVLGAAFHEDLPIIATCGMDRAVKIWHIRTNEAGDRMLREDKPLFSSTRIHKGRVLSVSWIGSDATLISHCAPAIMRKDSESDDIETYLEAGTVVVWRWLGMDRFFPAKYYHLQQQGIRQTVLRGCSSDYQESSSFKVLTAYAFRDMPDQYTVPRGVLYQSPYHDPLFLSIYPEDDHFLITNIALMKPRQIPSFDEMFAGILNTNVAPAAANEADETDGLLVPGNYLNTNLRY